MSNLINFRRSTTPTCAPDCLGAHPRWALHVGGHRGFVIARSFDGDVRITRRFR